MRTNMAADTSMDFSSKSKTLLWCGRSSPGSAAPTKKKQPGTCVDRDRSRVRVRVRVMVGVRVGVKVRVKVRVRVRVRDFGV